MLVCPIAQENPRVGSTLPVRHASSSLPPRSVRKTNWALEYFTAFFADIKNSRDLSARSFAMTPALQTVET
jgi:hypothetical protein